MNIRKIILGTCSALSVAAFGAHGAKAANTTTGVLPISITVQETCAFGNAQPITFQNVSSGPTLANDKQQGSLVLTCSSSQNGISISLMPQNQNPAAPALANGGFNIPYFFYTDAGFTNQYAGGSYATINVVGGTGSTIPVYAQILSGTIIPAQLGVYSDPVVATATF